MFTCLKSHFTIRSTSCGVKQELPTRSPACAQLPARVSGSPSCLSAPSDHAGMQPQGTTTTTLLLPCDFCNYHLLFSACFSFCSCSQTARCPVLPVGETQPVWWCQLAHSSRSCTRASNLLLKNVIIIFATTATKIFIHPLKETCTINLVRLCSCSSGAART